jgi:hypothetical protein
MFEEEYTRGIEMINGVPNSACIDAFTQGDCWALAIELSFMTGWPCVCIGTTDAYAGDEWAHVMVRMPDGMLLDIEGRHDREQVNETWGDGHWERSAGEIKEDVGEVMLTYCADWDVVRNVASVLLWDLQQRSPVQACSLVV